MFDSWIVEYPKRQALFDDKRSLSGKSKDQEARELLKDVSAFANADGGNLIIGANEPDVEGAGPTFLVGVDDGGQAATEIEQRCAACIDPPIPGLIAIPITLASRKSIVVVHVPPSPSRPHMVVHEPTRTRTYFIRHSETAQPMKSSEVRQAVLSSAGG